MSYLIEPAKFFTYSYQGDKYIDSGTLFGSQSHFLAAFTAIQKKYHPASDFELKIGTFKEGSFEVPYFVEVVSNTSIFQSLLTKENIDILYKSLAALVSMITIAKALKGSKPAEEVKGEDNKTELKFEKRESIRVESSNYQVYKDNPSIANSISKSFEALSQDDNVNGIKLYRDKGKDIIHLNKDDIRAIAQPSPFLDRTEKESLATRVSVFVKKVNFYRDKKKPWEWEFIFNAVPIKAVITDKTFEETVTNGRQFHRGSRLIVDLKKISKWNPRIRQYIVNKYEIIRIYDDNLPGGFGFQQDMFM
ncbi:hypothetical protein [Mucilaginibacter lacusdianchii]|uniref:hypothetical protein n=1 Tax=Mucilaginibacter lacusdianchii TaxID=2684211 RepID=UPI00131CFC0E|nr:hypothetical protein [Mucilaginibacter sp. JXJ CY 39]